MFFTIHTGGMNHSQYCCVVELDWKHPIQKKCWRNHKCLLKVNTDSLKKNPSYHNYTSKKGFKICLFNYLHFIFYHCYVVYMLFNFIKMHCVTFCFIFFFILENGLWLDKLIFVPLHCTESLHSRCNHQAQSVFDGHSM
jgi:hypothetical protein